jgi:peptide/nickel transport system ATP-binding protein
MEKKLLVVENLSIFFKRPEGEVCAVDDISFEVAEGATLGIVGESGCGKSVTAMSLLRLLPTSTARVTGKIWWRGEEVSSFGEEKLRQLRGQEIAMIFQEPMTSLNPVFTAGFQISEALKVHQPQLSTSEMKEKTLRLLEKVGISDPVRRFDAYPHEMSGGMRQRVMIAMALICGPKLLIADEPTTALDVTIQAQILSLIKVLQKDFNMAMILITHDLGVIAETVDDVLVMYAGKIAETAALRELFKNPLHPYTRGLLNSLPSRRTFDKRLVGIPGVVPDLGKLPLGCRFQDRCSLVQNQCRESEPPLEEKGAHHRASCFEV